MAISTIFISLLICISGIRKANGQTECTDAARQSNLQNCLESLRTLLVDNNKYFFGESYDERCPVANTMDCLTFVPVPPYNIMARMTNSNQQMQTSNIDRWLGVHYTSPAGEYTGCDHRVTEIEKTFFMDPVADITRTPWFVREQPDFTWDTSSDNSDQLYTLLFQDVGAGYTHSLWMNIPSNDLSRATVIKPYLGPGIFREMPGVYIYFLFKQNGRVDALSTFWQNKLADANDPSYLQLRWLEFMEDNNLNGPIAANWMTVTGDLYSVQNQVDPGNANNCAFYVNKELLANKQTRDFLPSSYSLSVFMRINFKSESLNVEVCCDEYNYRAKDVYLDPIGSGPIEAATARTVGSTHTVTLHKNKLYPNDATDFSGEYYTLIMIDPDGTSTDIGTNERPYLHWLVINIQDGTISQGTTITPYLGPGPPNPEPHNYHFLVYKQTGLLNIVSPAGYTIGCPSCSFDIKTFASNNNLELAGASWMKVTNDLFVKKLYVTTFGFNESVVCEGYEGYDDPCPSGASSSIYQRLTFLVVFIMLMYVQMC